MNEYVLTCCSTADLSKEHFERRNIPYVCFHYTLDGVLYHDDLGQTVSMENFYRKMTEGAEVKTSQVNTAEYIRFFQPFLEQGKDILHVTLSSGISGTYNSAILAKHMLEEDYPNRKIRILDSLSASAGYGLLMDSMADKRDEGMDIDTLWDWAMEQRLHLHHWFFSTDLTFFVKGGRVSKTSGAIGNLLNICPLLTVNTQGQLVVYKKVRTKNRVIKEIVEQMVAHAKDGINYSGKCYISMSACEEDAREVAHAIENTFPARNVPVIIYPIGTVIGCHTGPGTVALFFFGDKRTEKY